MLPVRPKITAHLGVLVMRSKLESLTEAFVNIARPVQRIFRLARRSTGNRAPVGATGGSCDPWRHQATDLDVQGKPFGQPPVRGVMRRESRLWREPVRALREITGAAERVFRRSRGSSLVGATVAEIARCDCSTLNAR